MSRTGLIILNYNDSLRTMELLHQVAQYDVWYRIVVVDNKSTDNSLEILKKCAYDKVDVIQSKKNGGYSYGNNFGIRYLINHFDIDICIIANPDIKVSEEVVRKMVQAIERKTVAAIAPVMLDKEGNFTKSVYEKRGYCRDLWEYLVPIPKRRRNYVSSGKKGTEIVPVYMLPGSFFAISTEALKKINYLDEDVFLYCEERILAERMHRQNLCLGLLKGEYFYHLHKDAQDGESSIRQISRVNNARIYYYKKYKEAGTIKIAVLEIIMRWHLFWYKKYIKKSDSQ